MERQNLILQITHHLTYLQLLVKNNNSMNLTDINTHAESFFAELLNLVFGYQLKNINIEEKNAAAIDLGDEANGIAIQVTSTRKVDKIKKTLKSFVDKKLHKKYKTLILLIIGDRPTYRTKVITEGAVSLDLSDSVWGIDSIINKLKDKKIDELKEILDFLKKNLPLAPAERESIEVMTFIKLISLLSDVSQPSAGQGFKEEPDPKGKIEHRFSQHAVFLKNLYIKLYTEYGAVLNDLE